VIITAQLGRELGVTVGDPLTLRVGRVALDARVTRVVTAVPALPGDVDAGGALVDLGTLAAAAFAETQDTITPTTWLLDVDGDPARAVEQLRDTLPDGAEALDRSALLVAQRTDPVCRAAS
jgi:hypothetical protein